MLSLWQFKKLFTLSGMGKNNLFSLNVSPKRYLQAGLQIMWAHSHLIRVESVGYLQIIRAEKADVCRSCDLYLQASTGNCKAVLIAGSQ